jgi:hypothetical protein
VDSFTENEIIPDVVDEGPEKCVDVKYGEGLDAELGNELSPEQTSIQPEVQWDASRDKLHIGYARRSKKCEDFFVWISYLNFFFRDKLRTTRGNRKISRNFV